MKRIVFVVIVGSFFLSIQAHYSFPTFSGSSGSQECGQRCEASASGLPYAASPLGGGARRPTAGHLHAPAVAADASDPIEGWGDDTLPHRYDGVVDPSVGEAVWDGALGGAGALNTTVARTARPLPLSSASDRAFRFSQSTAVPLSAFSSFTAC